MTTTHEDSGRCPSRLRLDRWLAGELAEVDVQQLEQHTNRCARCRPLIAEMRRSHDAFSPIVPDAVVQRVRERSNRRRSSAAWYTPLLAAATLLLTWTAWPKPPEGTRPDTVRSKGGPQLTFYVLHDGAVRPGVDGERVQPGDRLEFTYTSQSDTYLAIVSIDAARKATTYYAKDERAAKLSAASRAVLDQSTLLDDTLGPETVYALVCTQPIALAPLLQTLERAPEQWPSAAGCTVERFALLKVPR